MLLCNTSQEISLIEGLLIWVANNNIQALNTCKIVRAVEIGKYKNNFMSGCVGCILSTD